MPATNNIPEIYIVSACLVGLKTRYDSRVIKNPAGLEELTGKVWLPVCPEQLGGLPTPRIAADLTGGDGADVLNGRAKIINRKGVEVTENFVLGARQVLAIARSFKVAAVFLKAGSPSCGLTPIIGVTAALLQREGYLVREF